MGSLSSKAGWAVLRLGWGVLRLCLRHPFAVALSILLPITAVLGYEFWKLGPFVAAPLLPYLGTCLGLILVVFILWLLRSALARTIARQRRSLGKRAAKEVVKQSVGQGEAAAKAAVAGAQGALSSATEQLQHGLDQLLGIKTAATPPQAVPRLCPSCKRLLQPDATFCDSCGTRLPAFCKQCGQPVRPKDKTCPRCRARLR